MMGTLVGKKVTQYEDYNFSTLEGEKFVVIAEKSGVIVSKVA
jgi:hypothetical protein